MSNTPSRQTIINRATKEMLGWRIVLKLVGSKAIHTLESDGTTVKCTCQGFRIHGKGVSCKHTTWYRLSCNRFRVALGTELQYNHGHHRIYLGTNWIDVHDFTR